MRIVEMTPNEGLNLSSLKRAISLFHWQYDSAEKFIITVSVQHLSYALWDKFHRWIILFRTLSLTRNNNKRMVDLNKESKFNPCCYWCIQDSAVAEKFLSWLYLNPVFIIEKISREDICVLLRKNVPVKEEWRHAVAINNPSRLAR